jgi:hypothetical protein
MKWVAAVEIMAASGNYGWSRVATLVGALFPDVSTPEYSYFTACGRITQHHLFITADYLLCGVSRRPSTAWREGFQSLLAYQGA